MEVVIKVKVLVLNFLDVLEYTTLDTGVTADEL